LIEFDTANKHNNIEATKLLIQYTDSLLNIDTLIQSCIATNRSEIFMLLIENYELSLNIDELLYMACKKCMYIAVKYFIIQ